MENNKLGNIKEQGRIEEELNRLNGDVENMEELLDDITSLIISKEEDGCQQGGLVASTTLEERLYCLHCRLDAQRVVAEKIRLILINQLGDLKLELSENTMNCVKETQNRARTGK